MRTEFRMSAREGWIETPSWELEALFSERDRVIREAEAKQH